MYDIGWVISDRQGNVVKKVNYLVQETFFVPNVFNTAYYCNKRPIYMDLLEAGEVQAANWNDIIAALIEDLDACDITAAYNATFDFKKAIPFTEKYIYHLYRKDYNKWESSQKAKCEYIIAHGKDESENPDFLTPVFKLRGKEYPVVDLWGVACERLINIDKYRNYCLQNKLLTASAIYFKTSAETSFQYLLAKHDFVEDHTALSDALIEKEILTKALKKGKLTPDLKSFPFRELGTTYDYVKQKQPKYRDIVSELLLAYIELNDGERQADYYNNKYWKRILNIYEGL